MQLLMLRHGTSTVAVPITTCLLVAARATGASGYYALLGVSPGASTEDIQAAFRAAALKHHPDRWAGCRAPGLGLGNVLQNRCAPMQII